MLPVPPASAAVAWLGLGAGLVLTRGWLCPWLTAE